MKSETKIDSLKLTRRSLQGSYNPPPDKSITHRAVFFGALSPEPSVVRNPLLSGDCLSTVGAFKALGVPIKISKNEILIGKGERSSENSFRKFRAPKKPIDCGNSGTTMRLLSGVLSGQPFGSVLTGDSSLSRRPMKRVIEPLLRMGALIEAKENNFAPLRIQGKFPLNAISWESPVASAQVKSSILLAGLFAGGKTVVREPVRSRDHSEWMLEKLGIKIDFSHQPSKGRGSNRISIQGGSKIKGVDFEVPGDFSSAAFFIAAAILVPGSKLTLRSVNLNPTRTGFLRVVQRMGAKIKVKNVNSKSGEPRGDLEVRSGALKGVEVSTHEIPSMVDEVPILSVLATQAKGVTTVRGAGELRVKESDRLHAIATELGKMGAKIVEKKDGLKILGSVNLKGARVNSFEDHRMAMSLAVAGLICEGQNTIRDFDCIRISFPSFLKDLKSLIR